MGYYLSIKDFKIDSRKLILLMIALFIFATSMKMLSTGAIMPKSFALNYEATQSQVLNSWIDVSIFVILQAGSLFVIFKNLNFTGFRKSIVSISNLSYGMYLINSIMMFYITPFFTSLPRNGVEICIVIVLMSVFVFFASWAMVWMLSKVPVIGKYCS